MFAESPLRNHWWVTTISLGVVLGTMMPPSPLGAWETFTPPPYAKWERLPVRFYLNRPSRTLGEATSEGIIRRVLQLWMEPSCTSLRARYEGRVSAGTFGDGNETNTIWWVHSDSESVAVRLEGAAGIALPLYDFDNGNAMYDCDIEIENGSLFWEGYDRDREAHQGVLLHEVGHCLGLDHSLAYDSVMNYLTVDASRARSDDVRGICTLYRGTGPMPAPECREDADCPRRDAGVLCRQSACQMPFGDGGLCAPCSMADVGRIGGGGCHDGFTCSPRILDDGSLGMFDWRTVCTPSCEDGRPCPAGFVCDGEGWCHRPGGEAPCPTSGSPITCWNDADCEKQVGEGTSCSPEKNCVFEAVAGLGEPCLVDEQCLEGQCISLVPSDVSQCQILCGSVGDCPEGYACNSELLCEPSPSGGTLDGGLDGGVDGAAGRSEEGREASGVRVLRPGCSCGLGAGAEGFAGASFWLLVGFGALVARRRRAPR